MLASDDDGSTCSPSNKSERDDDINLEMENFTDLESRHWHMTIISMSIIGFFVNFVPSEAYLTKYLMDNKGLTELDLNNLVWPVDTYAYLAFMLPVGIAAEVFGYRTIIVLGLLARQATRILLIFGQGIGNMMAMQGTYALASATNVVFFAYAMVIVPQSFRWKSSAIVYAVYHLANVIASFIAQMLVDNLDIDLSLLFYVSWISQMIALVLFLPLMPRRVGSLEGSLGQVIVHDGWKKACYKVFSTYRSMDLCGWSWSLWWVFAYTSNSFFGNYYQSRIAVIDPDAPFGYLTMGVEFAEVLGSLSSLYVAKIFKNGSPSNVLVNLLVINAFGTVVLIGDWMSWLTSKVGVALTATFIRQYGSAILSTLAPPAISQSTTSKYYALLFTTNSFVALCIGSVIQAVSQHYGLDTVAYFRSIVFLDVGVYLTLVFAVHHFWSKIFQS